MQTSGGDPYGGDELLRDCVERALAPYVEQLPPDKIAAMRDYLIVFVTTHPAAEPLYSRLRKRPAVVRSTLVNGMRQRDAMGSASAAAALPKKVRRQ
jgi:hypothetical protein